MRDIIHHVSIHGFNSTDIVEAIKNLENEGQIIYTTINEDWYQHDENTNGTRLRRTGDEISMKKRSRIDSMSY